MMLHILAATSIATTAVVPALLQPPPSPLATAAVATVDCTTITTTTSITATSEPLRPTYLVSINSMYVIIRSVAMLLMAP